MYYKMIKINTEALQKIRAKASQNKERYNSSKNPDRKLKKYIDGGARETTFLYIGTYPGDRGIRPVPQGTVFWNSPDIEIYKNGVVIANNQINQGDTYQVIVTVRNDGDMNCPSFNIELFVTDPSLGFNVANATALGLQRGQVGRHSKVDIVFNLTASGNIVGHRCLFAQIFSVSCNEYPNSADGLDTVNDRHVAQQNLNIVQQGQSFKMTVNHIEGLGNDVFFRVLQEKKPSQELLLKTKVLLPKMTMTSPDKKFNIQPIGLKNIIGFDLPVFPNKPIPSNILPGLKINTGKDKVILPAANTPSIPNDITGKTTIAGNNFKYIKRYGKNADNFHFSLEKDSFHEVGFTVPDLGLKKGEMAVYNIEMKRPGSNAVIGGITLLVTS